MVCHRRRLLGAVRIGVVLHQRRVVPLYVVALLVKFHVVGCSFDGYRPAGSDSSVRRSFCLCSSDWYPTSTLLWCFRWKSHGRNWPVLERWPVCKASFSVTAFLSRFVWTGGSTTRVLSVLSPILEFWMRHSLRQDRHQLSGIQVGTFPVVA